MSTIECMEQDAFDVYKIPAFQRRGSIEARARKLTKPESKRIVVPAARVEPFPVFEAPVAPTPMPQVIDRRAVARAAENFFSHDEKKLYVRDMATKAAERFVPSSVPRTLVQKVKERIAKDEEYSHNLWGEEFDEPQSVYSSARRMKCVGIVTHYFEKINVCVVDLIDNVELGHRLIFEEEDHYLSEQLLDSMQINRQDVNRAVKGQQIGVKVHFIPKLGGKVWKVMV